MDTQFDISGGSVFVDDTDLALLQPASAWWITESGYARGYFPKTDAGPGFMVYMHRLIAGLSADDARDVDHINGVRIDNRRSNLRVCSHRENCWNTPVTSRNTSGYKGVTLDKRRNRWNARIRVNGRLQSLGYYETPEAAHAAYCEAAKKHFGEFARI